MLKKTLMTYILAICAIAGLQAMSPSNPIDLEAGKDLTPGALICNSKEDKCKKDEDQKTEVEQKKESPSSNLFSVFGSDHQDEMNLLTCKDCR